VKLRPNLLFFSLLLVCVPLAFQVSLVLGLMGTLNQVERQIEREARSAEFIFDGHAMLASIVDEFLSLGVDFGGDENCFTQFQKRMRIVKPKFNQYIKNLDTVPGRAKDAKELETLWASLSAEIFPPGVEDWRMEYIVGTRMSRLGIGIADKLDGIVKSVEVVDADEAQKTIASLNSVQQAVTFALVLMIVLTVVVFCAYHLVVEKPLARLAANGKLLSTRKPLPPVLNGAAEFVSLDRLLHQVADSVEDSIAREKQVVENAGDLICTIDEYGVFKTVNPFVERLLGYQPDEVLGSKLEEFLVERDREKFKRALGEAVVTRTSKEWQLGMLTKDRRTVETRWSYIHAPAHSSVFCIVSDISEAIRVEQLKEDFSETMSQDLKNPLVKLQNSLRAINAGEICEVPPAIENMLDRITQNVDRLVLLTNDLLDYQRLRGSELVLDIEENDLRMIIVDAFECVSSLAASKNINFTLPTLACVLPCDKMRVLQTLANLLSNAIKFTPKDGRIEVRLEQNESGVKLMVTDSGPGIVPEDRQRIFQAFEQVQNAQAKHGTGLGLAICKMFVEAHGGTIHVQSTHAETGETTAFANGETAGSSFVIDLPSRASL